MTGLQVLKRTVFAIATLVGVTPGVCAAEITSAWAMDKPETKARLLAGQVGKAAEPGKAWAAVEIVLADGWKTYWRFPGDAGGVPPAFDWSKSGNVAKVEVLYPAPARFSDKDGDTLGYKGSVVFPVRIQSVDAAKPVDLNLTLEYGICKDVCIPVEAQLTIGIPAGTIEALPPAVADALDHVPRGSGAAGAPRKDDPKLLKTEVKLDGAHPSLAIEAEFPGGTAKADVFVWTEAGYYIPLPKSGSGKDLGSNRLRYEIDLTGAVEPADIKGKSATVTLVSPQGLSEATFKLE